MTSRLDGLSSDGDVPDFAGLDSFATVFLQVHVADLPHTPRLGHPHVLVAVALARHHLVHLTDDTAAGSGRRPLFRASAHHLIPHAGSAPGL